MAYIENSNLVFKSNTVQLVRFVLPQRGRTTTIGGGRGRRREKRERELECKERGKECRGGAIWQSTVTEKSYQRSARAEVVPEGVITAAKAGNFGGF